MLYITVVRDLDLPDEIWDIDKYFDSAYEPEWIDNKFAKAVIRDIDKSEVVASRIIDSPYLGYIDPTHLSGGVKVILCLAFDKDSRWKFNIARCGDNCMRWIQAISKVRDINVYDSVLHTFNDDCYFNILYTNVNILCKNQMDVFKAWAEEEKV